MALEIGIWVYDEAPRLSTQMSQPICEALIPIQSARERNTDFWPLRPPPSSPQTRRKSLNDLIGMFSSFWCPCRHTILRVSLSPSVTFTNQHITTPGPYHYQENRSSNGGPSAFYQQTTMQNPWMTLADRALPDTKRMPLSSMSRMSPSESPKRGQTIGYTRERSSSNRNLPDANKLQIQPRRASDEVAASSSHRMMARISPAASRRSISVMNVGDSFQRSASRLGSQTNIMKAQLRRDSNQFQQQKLASSNASPTNKYGPMASNVSRASESQAIGVTPSGRRSSLAGLQSMTGYRSQKNSQSDATDRDSPLNTSQKWSREVSLVTSQQQQQTHPQPQSLLAGVGPDMTARQQHITRGQQQGGSSPNSAYPSCSSNSGSRRGSTAEQTPQLQRRGSFAMQTLRKLKRTMSLTKSGTSSQPGSNQDSRRSSSSSNNSTCVPSEDLAVSRPIRSG